MMLPIDMTVAQLRHAELLREAQRVHLANAATRYAAKPSLLSRMAKLLARFGGRIQTVAQPQARMSQRHLA